MNVEYDSYGFPKKNKVENRKDDLVKWLKICLWLFIAFLIFLKIGLMIISWFLSYDEFLQQIVERNISYVLDEDVVDLPPRVKRYTGNFSVLRISDVTSTDVINGASVTTQRKQYKLNKIFYTDVEADFDDTVQLSVGDSLEVLSNPISTRYKVTNVDSSTNTVIVELVEGSDPIRIGADQLKIASSLEDNVQVAEYRGQIGTKEFAR